MNKLRWLAILMGITILGITGFQGYWLNENYEREKQSIEIKTNSAFHQTILGLQSSKLNIDSLIFRFDSLRDVATTKVTVRHEPGSKRNESTRHGQKPAPISMINLLQEKMMEPGDTGKGRTYIISGKDGFTQKISTDSLPGMHLRTFNRRVETIDITSDSLSTAIKKEIELDRAKNPDGVVTITYGNAKDKGRNPDSAGAKGGIFIEKYRPVSAQDYIIPKGIPIPHDMRANNPVFRFLYTADSTSLKDSVTIKEITTAFTDKLNEEKITGLEFSVNRLDSGDVKSANPNDVTIGFAQPITYRLSLDNELSYLFKRLTLPLLFSLLLVGITIVSFVLLYRNLVKQRRLAELKNDFISNVTHELKTPIATVGVAIEALKSFNAIQDPERTKEYLEISQNELQRLSLLVDKVLKLSMFEKKEMELKKEQFNCKQLTEEVMNSMRLQFEKYHAKVNLNTEGENFIVEADKLHITSVIYNLLDNALKYSRENPVIDVQLKSDPGFIQFSVSDNGIGIASAYKEKVFDKFFRVPTGDKHNIKGYGLGLSYVAEVIKRHQGKVHVESELGKGSTFTAKLPYV
jgi:two-component system, OmpR family, phosphate regulon sensor histidine kinase PhoR